MPHRFLKGGLSQSLMSSSLPTLPSLPPDQFYLTTGGTNPPVMQFARRSEPSSDALYGPVWYERYLEKGTLWNLCTRKFLNNWHAVSSKPWRGTRYALFYRNHQLQIAVREYQRQARDPVSQLCRNPPKVTRK